VNKDSEIMKKMINTAGITVAASLLLALGFNSTKAQTQTPSPQSPSPGVAQSQTAQAPNLQTELNLRPEQIQKWRALNRELREQEVTGVQKVRQAKFALSEAMESPNPNEEEIKQRAKELADAQSAMTQLQALRQARVLQILDPEQRIKLREIQATIRQQNQERRAGNQPFPGMQKRRPNALQRNQNPNARTPRQQRRLMQQQPQRKP
jgi:Spy/CpxP family protein refolding chaperone